MSRTLRIATLCLLALGASTFGAAGCQKKTNKSKKTRPALRKAAPALLVAERQSVPGRAPVRRVCGQPVDQIRGELTCRGPQVTSLAGLRHVPHLRTLTLWQTRVSDLSVLVALPQLIIHE